MKNVILIACELSDCFAHHNPVRKKNILFFWQCALNPDAPYGLENMVNKCLLQMYSHKSDEITDLDLAETARTLARSSLDLGYLKIS